MPITAQVEGIGNFEFPDGTSPDVIHAAVQKVVMQHNAPAPLSGPIGPAPDPILNDKEINNKANLQEGLKSVGKGALSFTEGLGHMLAPKNSFWDTDDPDINTEVGGGEQKLYKGIGETLPVLALNAVTGGMASGAGVLPVLGRVAIQSGIGALANKAEGGSATAGALIGGGLGALGEGLNTVANPLFKKAFNIKSQDLGYGADPVDFIRNNTSSWTIPGVGNEAKQVVNTARTDNALRTAGKFIDLNPAANEANNQVLQLQNQLFQDPEATAVENRVLSPFEKINNPLTAHLSKVPADQGLAIRTGLGRLGNYNPLRPDPEAVSLASKPVRHLVSEAIKALDPQIAENDTLIQNGVPVINRGKSAELAADPFERMADAIGRPTGGLVSRLAAGHFLGPLGYVLPDLLTAPGSELGLARLLTKAPAVAKAATGGVLGTINQQ